MRRIVLLLVLLHGCHLRAGAQPAPCALPDLPEGLLRYTIDLSNGATEGKMRYQIDDQVQILFKNKNPFLYEYRIKIEEQAVPEPALELFFKVFNTSATAALLVAAPGAIAQSEAAILPQSLASACKADTDKLIAEFTKLKTDYEDLKSQAEQISALFAQLQADIDLEERSLQNPAAHCEALVRSAEAILGAINQALDEQRPGSLGERLRKFIADLAAFTQLLNTQSDKIAKAREALTNAGCRARDINNQLKPFEQKLEEFLAAEKGLRETSARFAAAVQELRAEARIISDILLNPQSFSETRQVGDYDEITLVTVTVDRRDKKAAATAFSNFLVKKLRFGGRQRFALAAGAAFTPLDDVTYQVIQGFPIDSMGMVGSMPARIVGLKNDSSERVNPLIMLHTRIFERTDWISGWHLSLGFAGATGDNGVNLEYLTGLSLSFAEERFFLTVGGYNGRTEELQDGFYLGRELPSAITSIPVARGRDWDIGFALSVRFR